MRYKNIPLHFSCCAVQNNKLIFMPDYLYCLFQYDWETEETSFLDWFGEFPNMADIYGGILEIAECENNLFLYPGWYDYILCYDSITGQKEKIDIPFVDGKEFKIRRVVTYGTYAWIFSFDLHQGIYFFDMKKKHLKRETAFSNNVEQYKGKICDGCVIVEKKQFLTALYDTNIILEFDFNTGEIHSVTVPKDDLHIHNVVCYDDYIYMVLTDSCDVYEWKRSNDRLKQYVNLKLQWSRKVEEEYVPYNDIVCLDNEVYIIPYASKEILKINSKNEILEKVLDLTEFQCEECRAIFLGHRIMGKKLCFYPYGMTKFFIYDVETKLVQTKKVSIDVNKIPVYNELLHQKWFTHGENTILENEYISVRDINYQVEVGTAVFGTQNYGKKYINLWENDKCRNI